VHAPTKVPAGASSAAGVRSSSNLNLSPKGQQSELSGTTLLATKNPAPSNDIQTLLEPSLMKRLKTSNGEEFIGQLPTNHI